MQNRFLTNSCLALSFLLLGHLEVNAQICKSTIPASTPDAQFVDHGNGTITDSKTGLMWKKCSEGLSGNSCNADTIATFTWKSALEQPGTVNNVGFAGYTDWRLPNIKELTSIVEEKCYDSSINLNHFPNTPSSGIYWSGSADADFLDNAWNVSFYSGYNNTFPRNYLSNVRLVRGGQ